MPLTRKSADVVVLGGSLAGASSGLLLKRALKDQVKVVVIEKSHQFERRVGESTLEVGGCFLTRVLRLSHYLAKHHVPKHGLRLWFSKTSDDCPSRCVEIGPKFQARLPTFQLDRAKLDQHLLEIAAAEGCEVLRPANVRSVELGGVGMNKVICKVGDETIEIDAKWVIDATGKAAVIGRQRGTIKPLSEHPTKSIWARFRNVQDLDDQVIHAAFPEMAATSYASRTAATNHLMGPGWWCWVIPLQNGDVSAGVTFDTRLFQPKKAATLTETLQQQLLLHPIGRLMFANAEAVESDTLTYSQLAYQNTEVCGPGWACVGDAGGFMDPFYSHGIDFIGHSVITVNRIIVKSLMGEDADPFLNAYHNEQPQCYRRWFDALYKDKYYYLGDADLMKASFLLDISAYFLGPVQLVYRETEKEFSMMPYHGPIGGIFATLMRCYNRRLVKLGQQRTACGRFGQNNTDWRYLVRPGFAPGLASLRFFIKGLFAWGKCECQGLAFRFMPKLGEPMPQTSALSTVETRSRGQII